MHISRVFLDNYRNIKRLDLELNPQVNIFWGLNGQGKTNFLESVFLLATASSPRAFNDSELVKWGEDYFFVKGKIEEEFASYTLSIGYSNGRKKINFNGQGLERTRDLLGKLLVVYFTPEDLQLIKGPPSLRRNFLDREISLLYPLYYDNLRRYKSVLQQRNNVLKDLREKKNTSLEVWNEQLIALGAEIIVKRIEVLEGIKPLIREKYLKIADKQERLDITYSSSLALNHQASLADWQRAFGDALKRRQTDEVFRGTTLFGPHRDELSFFLGTKDLRNFGSQGQQRSAVLALKLSELEYMAKITAKQPILLLDDVFSELDSRRQRALLELLEEKIQTIITTTDSEFRINNRAFSYFRVSEGNISRE